MSLSSWFKNIFKRKDKVEEKVEVESHKLFKPLKLGLALSGGGTRGIAYIGVFKAFLESGVDFDYVAGTSVGSIMAAVYASGMSVEEMIVRAKELRVKDVVSSKIAFVPSKTMRLENVIAGLMQGKNFEDLKKPVTVVAVDIISGSEVHITKGDLVKAVAGSCAVPTVFNPVDFEDMRLLDGGLQNNIPADVVRDMGADIVIAVDLNPTRGYGTTSTKYVDVIKVALRILMKSNSVKGYVHSDHIIKLNLSRFDQRKIDGIDEMIQEGYDATMREMPAILDIIRRNHTDEDIKKTAKRLKALERQARRQERLEQKQRQKQVSTEVNEIEQQEHVPDQVQEDQINA